MNKRKLIDLLCFHFSLRFLFPIPLSRESIFEIIEPNQLPGVNESNRSLPILFALVSLSLPDPQFRWIEFNFIQPNKDWTTVTLKQTKISEKRETKKSEARRKEWRQKIKKNTRIEEGKKLKRQDLTFRVVSQWNFIL